MDCRSFEMKLSGYTVGMGKWKKFYKWINVQAKQENQIYLSTVSNYSFIAFVE